MTGSAPLPPALARLVYDFAPLADDSADRLASFERYLEEHGIGMADEDEADSRLRVLVTPLIESVSMLEGLCEAGFVPDTVLMTDPDAHSAPELREEARALRELAKAAGIALGLPSE